MSFGTWHVTKNGCVTGAAAFMHASVAPLSVDSSKMPNLARKEKQSKHGQTPVQRIAALPTG